MRTSAELVRIHAVLPESSVGASSWAAAATAIESTPAIAAACPMHLENLLAVAIDPPSRRVAVAGHPYVAPARRERGEQSACHGRRRLGPVWAAFGALLPASRAGAAFGVGSGK